LIQTIGRAARNVSGEVHMYADTITPSMQKAIEETNRRRDKQIAYNREMGVDPQPLRKKIADILDDIVRSDDGELIGGSGRAQSRGKTPVPGMASKNADAGAHSAEFIANMPKAELALLIQQLQDQMHNAAAELHFELAARLRDEVNELKKEFRAMDAAGVQ
jgi:excinuclease ABC subunit B